MRCKVCEAVLDMEPDGNVVVCAGCGYSTHRRTCWEHHWCGQLTDRNGYLVTLGTILRYYSSERTYQVVEILGTFTRGGTCYGRRIDKKGIYDKEIIRPRMMEELIQEVSLDHA